MGAVSAAPTELLEGKWALERALGKGGMGTVWLATDLTLHRKVAIKMLAGRFAADEALVARFEREARMMARLDHPNLVPVYAVGRHAGVPFIVMKLLEGVTLAEQLRRRPRLELGEVLPIVRQLCLGLQCIHQGGVVHRDIKPANVFLAPDGHVTLLDLGVAREAQSTMTVAGAIVGTPRYMSPEQVLGMRVDHRADLYALATVAFELVTGAPPFDGGDGVSLLRAHLDTPPPDASQVARLPAALGAMLQRGLAKKPEHRFESASEFSAAFERAAGEPLGPRPTPTAATTLEPLAPTVPIHPAVQATQVLPPRRPPTARRPPPPPRPAEPAPAESLLRIQPRRRWLGPAAVAALVLGGWLTFAMTRPAPASPSDPPAQQPPPAPAPSAGATPPPVASPATPHSPVLSPTPVPAPSLAATTTAAEVPRPARPTKPERAPEARPTRAPRKAEPAAPAPAPSETTPGLKELPELPPRAAPPEAAAKPSPKHRPAQAAYGGKLFTKEQTVEYYAARDRGASEEAAARVALGLPAEAPTTAPASPAAAKPAPRKIAYDGHLFDEAEVRRYGELKAAGYDHESAARAVMHPPPTPP
jgi:serine/threonine protein kinase